MSALAEEVVQKLARKREPVAATARQVDDVLQKHNVPTTASKSTPVPLRIAKLSFRGVKVLDPSHAAAAGRDANPKTGKVEIPFSFEWQPPVGVLGIGTGGNLRGKSTVLHVLTWALTGKRPDMKPDVISWIEAVEVDWTVGPDLIRVRFDVADGEAQNGCVELVATNYDNSGKLRQLATFADADEFEGVMGSVMMGRLRLVDIPVWTKDRQVDHTWPSFSSSMAVRHNQLDPIVGNVSTLAVRMMQAFIGTDWVVANARAMSALRRLETAAKGESDKARTASEVAAEALAEAEAVVVALEGQLAVLGDDVPDVAAMMSSATRATDLAREAHELERQLMAEAASADTLRLQIRAAKARNHALVESAQASRFFHQMQPTSCPRCTTPVKPEQVAAEHDEDKCSLCSKDLHSATTVQTPAADALGYEEDEDDEVLDGVQVLESAVAESESRMSDLRVRINEYYADGDAARARYQADRDRISAATDRNRLQFELASANGAVQALAGQRAAAADSAQPTFDQLVLDATNAVLTARVADAQKEYLDAISADIGQLVAKFGAPHLTDFALSGNANMDVKTNGVPTTYSGLVDGEKLRVKIATAVALIRHGHAAGLGRHPGFLILDSPAAEEMPDSDLATIVEALLEVAAEEEMQIVVATRSTQPLVDMLPDDHRRVVTGDAYLW